MNHANTQSSIDTPPLSQRFFEQHLRGLDQISTSLSIISAELGDCGDRIFGQKPLHPTEGICAGGNIPDGYEGQAILAISELKAQIDRLAERANRLTDRL